MRRYTREELNDLAAGYALGATSPEEAVAVEQALPDMPELAAEIASYREVAVQLATQRAVAPPPELRGRLLERVRETKGAPIGAAPIGAAPIGAAPSASAPSPAARATRRVPGWMVVGLAASLLAAAGLAYQNAQLRRAADGTRVRLASVEAQLTRREQTLDALLEAEKDLYVAQMVGADTAKGPGIQLFWNAKQQRGVLHAFRLRPAPAGRSYQLWLLVDGKPYSAKVFNSDPDGHALVENLTLPSTTAGVTQVLLTEEPAGGSPGPTTTPFLGGTLAKT